MSSVSFEALAASLSDLMAELIDGGPGGWAYFTDGRSSGGVTGALARIPAERAFASGTAGGRGAAGLVQHLVYSAELFARALRGDHSGYATADWEGSWSLASDVALRAEEDAAGAWSALCARLVASLTDARAALEECAEWDVALTRTGAIGNVCHFAYHLGQLRWVGSLSGPA